VKYEEAKMEEGGECSAWQTDTKMDIKQENVP